MKKKRNIVEAFERLREAINDIDAAFEEEGFDRVQKELEDTQVDSCKVNSVTPIDFRYDEEDNPVVTFQVEMDYQLDPYGENFDKDFKEDRYEKDEYFLWEDNILDRVIEEFYDNCRVEDSDEFYFVDMAKNAEIRYNGSLPRAHTFYERGSRWEPDEYETIIEGDEVIKIILDLEIVKKE